MSGRKSNEHTTRKTRPQRPEPSPKRVDESVPAGLSSRQGLEVPDEPGSRALRRQTVVRLQRLSGNRAVARRLDGDRPQPAEANSRADATGHTEIDPAPPTPAAVRRWPWDDTSYTVEGIISERAADDVGELSDAQIRAASLSQKMALVRIILNENWWVGPFDEWQLERIWRLMSADDLEGMVSNANYRGLMRGSYDRGATIAMSDSQLRTASTAAKMLFVQRILQGNWWVGPYLEGDLERIWESFTSAELEEMLGNSTYAELFRDSAERGAAIEDLPPIPTMRSRFRNDVRGIAGRYLNQNEELVQQEMDRFGIRDRETVRQPRDTMAPPPGLGTRPMSGAQVAELQELQALAAQLRRAEIARDRLLATPVGYEMSVDARPGLIGVATGTDLEEHARDLYERGDSQHFWTVTFNPTYRPEFGPFGDEQPPLPDYDQVKAHYDQVIAEIGHYTATYPTLFALVQADSDENQVESFALAEPEQARAIMGERLNEVLGHIRESRPIVNTDEEFYLDLKPIHYQMFGGSVAAPSGTDWSQGLPKWVGQDEVSDHETVEFWTTLGLSGLAAAAFLVAEFVTLGSATFIIATGVGLGAGLAQAGRSWEQYEQLAAAADATVSDEARLVSQEQTDSAHLAAVLDTVFVFLDALGPAVRGARVARGAPAAAEAAEAGARAADLEGLSQLGRQGAEAAPLTERAIVELGVEETTERMGKSADELLEIVGRDSPAGERLLAFSRAAGAGLESSADLIVRLPNLADEVAGGLSRAEADRLVVQAVERLGPRHTLQLMGGWKKLSTLLGNDALAGRALLAWRNQLMRDLEQFVETSLRTEADEAGEALVQRTGSTDFTSDLDISFLGPNAAANRQAGLNFLASRVGVSADDLSRLLYTDLFTDPRRMHLYDLIDDAALREQVARRAAGFEEELIWNRRLHEAVETGDDAMASSIREQMEQLGVRQTTYTPLTAEEIQRLSGEIDNLHGQLQRAARAGDTAEQARLAEQIARKQAMINAAEGGGYFSGGGVRRSVSEREEFPGFTPAEAATEARRVLPAQQFTHVLDQLPKLDEAVRMLARAERPDQIAAALKGVGKYGQRLSEVVGVSLGRNLPEMAQFRRFAARFEQLIASARSSAVDPLTEQLARSPETLVQGTRQALTEFEQASAGILRIMQQRAALETPGLFGGNLRNMQFLIRAHTASLAAFDTVISSMDDFLRAQRTVGRAGESAFRPGGGEEGGSSSL